MCVIDAINASTGSRVFTYPAEYLNAANRIKRKDPETTKKIVARGNGMPLVKSKPLFICDFATKYCRVGMVEYAMWEALEIQEYAKQPDILQMALSKGPGRSVVACMETLPSPDILNRSHACAFVYNSFDQWMLKNKNQRAETLTVESLQKLGLQHYLFVKLYHWSLIPVSGANSKEYHALMKKL